MACCELVTHTHSLFSLPVPCSSVGVAVCFYFPIQMHFCLETRKISKHFLLSYSSLMSTYHLLFIVNSLMETLLLNSNWFCFHSIEIISILGMSNKTITCRALFVHWPKVIALHSYDVNCFLKRISSSEPFFDPSFDIWRKRPGGRLSGDNFKGYRNE